MLGGETIPSQVTCPLQNLRFPPEKSFGRKNPARSCAAGGERSVRVRCLHGDLVVEAAAEEDLGESGRGSGTCSIGRDGALPAALGGWRGRRQR